MYIILIYAIGFILSYAFIRLGDVSFGTNSEEPVSSVNKHIKPLKMRGKKRLKLS